MSIVTVQIELTDEVLQLIANKVSENNNSKPKPTLINKVYTCKEVAEIVGLSQHTIAIHCRKGLLKATRIGKSYSITHENLNNYINGKH